MTLPPAVFLAARHLDPSEGPMVEGHVVTATDVAALCQVRDYLGGLHAAGQQRKLTRDEVDALLAEWDDPDLRGPLRSPLDPLGAQVRSLAAASSRMLDQVIRRLRG